MSSGVMATAAASKTAAGPMRRRQRDGFPGLTGKTCGPQSDLKKKRKKAMQTLSINIPL
jgi:hypothetical protein